MSEEEAMKIYGQDMKKADDELLKKLEVDKAEKQRLKSKLKPL